ncbi:phage tail protein [Aeromonas caviae]
MSQVITNAFEQYWQSSLAAEQPVVLDEFILANIPNLDITSPIDPDTSLPPESQIVHRQNVDQRGRINNNAVAYTIVMDTTVGDFSFNAMYLRNKQNGVIGMIVYKGRETKLKTDQSTGQTGNSLVKSMLMGYDQAAEATLTNVDAGTWQIDYAARLRGQDEDLRQLASQLYGHHTFIGDGFKVVQQDGGHQVTPGVAIIGGLRVELKAPEVIYPGSKPIGVWVDVHRAGSLLSEHQNHFTIITSVADLTDHVDGSGYQHFVAKLGSVQADSTIIDDRGQVSSSGSGAIPDTFALWRRSMAEAGYDLIGQFGVEMIIETANQVVLSKDGKGVYAWTGDLPKKVELNEVHSGMHWVKCDNLLRDTFLDENIYISKYKMPFLSVHDAVDSALAAAVGRDCVVVCDVGFVVSRPIIQPPRTRVRWECVCYIGNDFIGDVLYQIDGGYAYPFYDPSHTWTLPGRTSMCGLRLYAKDFEKGVDAEALVVRRSINTACKDVVITGANIGGLRVQEGYEPNIQDVNVIVSNARSDASIGLGVNCSDGYICNVVPVGYATGCRVTGGSNHIEAIHPWGNTEGMDIGELGRMFFGFYVTEGAEKNTFLSCYADSPTRIDVYQDPSRENGGAGYVVDGWYSSLLSCKHLGHHTNPDKTIIPLIISAQQCEVSGFNDLKPLKTKQPVVVFEKYASPVNNTFRGGSIGRYISGNFGYFTPRCNFLSSVSFKQTPDYGVVDLAFTINDSGVLVPSDSNEILYITLPDYIQVNTIRGFASVSRFLYLFRKAYEGNGRVPVDVVAEIVPSSNRVQFVILYADGGSSGYVRASAITNGDSGVFATFVIEGVANDRV